MHDDERDLVSEYGDEGVVLRFYIPLQEALLLPDSWIRPRLRQLSADEQIQIAQESGKQGFSLEQILSMCFLSLELPKDIAEGFNTAMRAARRALPGMDQLQDPDTTIEALHTVVEITAPALDASEAELTRVFDEAVDAISRVQRAYAQVTGHDVDLLTRERCPMLLPVFAHPPDVPPDQWHQHLKLFAVNTNFETHPKGSPPLEDEKLEQIDDVHGGFAEQSLFVSVGEFLTDARRAFNRYGDARSALINSALACEVLLDELLGSLLWEEGERPEDWSTYFDENPLLQRVRSNAYSGRLRGDWRLNVGGPIADWSNHIRSLRNRLLHTSYVPTAFEARSALESTVGLMGYLAGLLRDVTARYPRTAFMYGGEKLFSRTALGRHLRPLQRSDDEPSWKEVSRNWQDVMNRGRKDGAWSLGEPSLDECSLLAVKHATGEARFALLHAPSERAASVSEPDMSLEQRASLAQLSPPPGMRAISVKLMDNELPRERGPWLAAYRLVPMRPVMVTGERFDGIDHP